MSKIISCLLLFYYKLRDWLTKFAPRSQPMGNKTKPIMTPFPALGASYTHLFRVLIGLWLFTSVVIGRSNNFGFGFMTPLCTFVGSFIQSIQSTKFSSNKSKSSVVVFLLIFSSDSSVYLIPCQQKYRRRLF